MLDPIQLEVDFSVALVRMLRHFNMLELNVGLTVAKLCKWADPESPSPRLSTMSLEKKVVEFRRLSEKCNLIRSDAQREELERWSARVDDVRSVRNVYAHGHWDLLPLRAEHPVSLFAPPWMHKKLGITSEIKMTLGDLQRKALLAENVGRDFMTIRRKLGL